MMVFKSNAFAIHRTRSSTSPGGGRVKLTLLPSPVKRIMLTKGRTPALDGDSKDVLDDFLRVVDLVTTSQRC